MYQEVLSVSPELSIIELADMMQVGKPKSLSWLLMARAGWDQYRNRCFKSHRQETCDECFKHPGQVESERLFFSTLTIDKVPAPFSV